MADGTFDNLTVNNIATVATRLGVGVTSNMTLEITAGRHVEIGSYHDGSTQWGVVQGYDRSAATYRPLWIAGSKFNFVNGSVGIGTASPLALLHVEGNAAFKGPRPWIDVTAYGAYADDTNASATTAAVQAAITAAGAAGGAVVYFPPGTYRLDSQLVMDDTGGRTSSALMLLGAGARVSNLKWVNSSGAQGFKFAANSIAERLTISQLSFLADTDRTDTIAIDASWPTRSSVVLSVVTLRDFTVEGTSGSARFGKGVYLKQGTGAVITGFLLKGKTNVIDGSTVAIELVGDMTNNYLSSGTISSWQTGVLCNSDASGAPEGVHVADIEIAPVNTGVHFNQGHRPGTAVHACHILASAYGIRADDAESLAIVDNLFYRFDSGTWRGVSLGSTSGGGTTSDKNRVANNQFELPATTTGTTHAIYIENGNFNTVMGNTSGAVGTVVYISSVSGGNIVIGNARQAGTTTVSNNNSGGGNIVANNTP